MSQVPSICRSCTAFCPIVVTVEDGRAIKVEGDRAAPLFDGYSCPKGRALPEQHNDPHRLLVSRVRTQAGGWAQISSTEALEAIAGQVTEIIAAHGPRSVAIYNGTGSMAHQTSTQMASSWLRAIGSSMMFGANAIDKPAANIANALHGIWVAGPQRFETADTWMIVGGNPVIAKSNGAPANNPGMRLKEGVAGGMKLIVIDPRVTETARRAAFHLQCLPGQDPTILAAIIHVILEEDLIDREFVAAHTVGIEALREATEDFTPEFAARRAGMSTEQIIEAARTFARAKRGCAVSSTGPSFSTQSNLSFYLTLCLNTICGRWARAEEVAPHPNVLLPAYEPKAQAMGPFPAADGQPMRVRGLSQNASGMPTAVLPDEILTEGEGKIRALFCLGGNPVLAFPDQSRTVDALKDLDLLVVFDCVMSETAQYANYVIAPPMSLEVPGSTIIIEALKFLQPTRGYTTAFAQYTPAVVEPPAGSDLMSEAEFFFRLAQQMGLQLEWINQYGWAHYNESEPSRFELDMTRVPNADELIELKCRNSRLPLQVVKQYPHGNVFDSDDVLVSDADPGCEDRLQVGDKSMMECLKEVRDRPHDREDGEFPFRLVCRRINNANNSSGRTIEALMKGKDYNPLLVHPDDLAKMDIREADHVVVRSSAGEVACIAEPDASLRRGVVSLTHGFGSSPDEELGAAEGGAAVNRLVSMDESDSLTGIPRMSAIPVAISRMEQA